jgi:hypothetical protein
MPQHCLLHPIVLVLAALLLLGGEPARGQGTERERAAAVKAGMVVNFIRYTRWPESAFEHPNSPIVVTLVGDDDIHAALIAALRDQTIGDRTIIVRRRWYPLSPRGEFRPRAEDLSAFYHDLRTSHVAFFGYSERARLAGHFDQLRGSNVLTISDIPGFAERGGMLGFALRERRIAFDANVDAINDTELRVSSQVLNLARIIRTPGRRPEDER